MIAEIILFADINCSGTHTHICVDTNNLNDQNHGFFLSDFNDVTSSFIIVSGRWTFFKDWHWENQMGPGGGKILGPGVFEWIEDSNKCLGPGTNDALSSLKCVSA